jgi:predicted nucleic acid-binding protein
LKIWKGISGVADRWVVNASPVILLAKADVIGFLPQLCDELVIPAGVVDEVQDAIISDAGRGRLQSDGKKFIQSAPLIHGALASWRGGAGEAQVISYALQNPGFTAILDDRRARALATRNGVAVLGSLRIIVLTKQRGLIAQAKPALEKLRGVGAWVSDELINRAIALAGEA